MTDSFAPLRIVHTESSLGWGGQELRVLTEAEAFLSRGHRVEIWAAPGSNILDDAERRGIPSRALPIARRGIGALRALRRVLAEARPDVVNTHSSTDSWLVALARLTLRRPPPVVRTRHISAPVSRDVATRWLYCRSTSHIVTTGESLRQELIVRNRFPAERITSVPTGIDISRFTSGDRFAARRHLGLPQAVSTIGVVATLRSWKGHRFLIEAFARLQDCKARLLIVGDGPIRAEIARYAGELGLASRVLMPGNQREVLPWLQALDVFVLPSYANEGIPQAIMQAMAIGLPVISTPVGGISEIVRHEETGLLVAPRDPLALRAAIERVLSDPTTAKIMGERAKAFAFQQFGIDHMRARMEQVFHCVRHV